MSPRITFSEREAIQYFTATGMLPFMDEYSMQFPCGHCAACLINKRKAWSTKITHEMSMFSQCCFVTLTYADDKIPITSRNTWDDRWKRFGYGNEEYSEEFQCNIPRGPNMVNTLSVYDIQCFMKRVRRHLQYLPKREKNRVGRDHVTTPIRYFAVGEYGPKTHRPHYHIIIFGWSPSDAYPYFRAKSGQLVFRSPQLEALWPFGHVTVESCGNGTAQYCAQYVTKKLTKKAHRDDRFVVPEFFRYSTRGGGIGTTWLKKWYRECLKIDRPYVTYRNGQNIIKASIPQSYRIWIRKNKVKDYLNWRREIVNYIQFMRLEGRPIVTDWDKQAHAIAMDKHKQDEFFNRCEL